MITVQYLAVPDSGLLTATVKALGMNIEYVIEESPLGTAGSVQQRRVTSSTNDEPFLVISGDALTDFDLTALVAYHRRNEAQVTMALYHVADPLDYGVINIADDGQVTQFLEKPSWGEVTSDTVNTGIYVVQPEVLDSIPADRVVDWSQHVFPPMLAQEAALYGYVAQGYWCDIGTLGEYRRANADLLNGVLNLGELGQRIGPGIWAGGTVEIAPDAQLFGPIYLGEEVEIRSKVTIHGPAAIRDYTVLDNRAQIRSQHHLAQLLYRRARPYARRRGRPPVQPEDGCGIVFEGAVIGDRTVIGRGRGDPAGRQNLAEQRSREWRDGQPQHHLGFTGPAGALRPLWSDRRRECGSHAGFVARLGAAFGSVLPKG